MCSAQKKLFLISPLATYVFYKKMFGKIWPDFLTFRLPDKNLMCSARKFLKIFDIFLPF